MTIYNFLLWYKTQEFDKELFENDAMYHANIISELEDELDYYNKCVISKSKINWNTMKSNRIMHLKRNMTL